MALSAATASTVEQDGRPRQAASEDVIACAREFAEFVWAIATE
jgi:hypothetical protein